MWFFQFASQVRRDPALIYREPATLEKLLQRANDAERAGDRATAITTYRFVMTVGRGVGEAGPHPAPHLAAGPGGVSPPATAATLPRSPGSSLTNPRAPATAGAPAPPPPPKRGGCGGFCRPRPPPAG